MLGASGKGYTDNIIQNFFLTSFLFVDFFFILSGYIMAESYDYRIRTGKFKKTSIEYFMKRAQKILPNYYFWLFIAIFLSIATSWYLGNEQIEMSCVSRAAAMHLILMQNLIGSCYYFNTPLWSIAVEFLAYFAFPILIIMNPRASFLLGAGLFIYLAIFFLSPTIDLLNGALSVMRCFAGFICGIGGAKMVRRSYADYVHVFLLVTLFLSIAYDLQVLALLLMWMITVATAKNVGFLSDFARLKYPYLIGRASFSIYLAHIPVSMVLSPVAYKVEAETGIPFGSDWTLVLPIKIMASGLVGIFAFQQVECRFSAFFERRKVLHSADSRG